jgi:hypothetical protein
MHDDHHEHPAGDTNFEPTDAHVMPLLVIGAILVVGTAASFLIGYLLLKYSTERPASSAFVNSPLDTGRQPWNTVGGVRLQQDPTIDLQKYLHAEYQTPHTYGVISDEPEIYHFPVERAIDIVVAGGLPEFKPFGDGSLDGTAVPAETPEAQPEEQHDEPQAEQLPAESPAHH